VCSNGTAINVSRSGTATCVVALGQLVAANAPYTVAASYSGDLSYTGSGGGPVSQGIAPLGSKAFIAGNPMPPVHDTPVHFTASVVPSQTGVTPTGTVTFMFTSQPITVSGCTLSTSSGNRASGCPIPLADLQVGDVVSDLTTPGDIPSGTTVQAIGTNAVTLSNAPTSATGQEILFSPPVTVEGCSLSAGTSMVSGCSIPTADLQVGDVVTDQTTPADIPAGTTVGSIGADTVTLSNPPTTDTGQTIVFTPQPIVVTGCTLSATNSIVSGCSIPVANIQVGDVVADLTTPRNIPGGTTVQSIGSSTLTLSKAPTNASGQTVIITPPAPPDPAIVCGGGSNSITLTTSGATCSFAGGLPQAGSPFGVVASYSGDANDGASTSHSLFVKVH
jgi:hypothetical protein